MSLTVVELAPGVVEPAHIHPGFEILYGLSGIGHVSVEGRSVPLSTGQVVHIAEGAVKAIANDGDEPLKVLAVLVLDPSRPPFTPVSEGSPA